MRQQEMDTKGTQVPAQERWPGFTDALHALMGSGLDPRRERLISSRGTNHSRLTIEVPARVFHQGPGEMPNMTGCSFAVRHLQA
jgi:hypothetical protein